MKKLWPKEDIPRHLLPIKRENWTALIPAAGRGSRLGFSRPKILYPIAGKMILEWLSQLLLPFCAKTVLVLSPEGKDEVLNEAKRFWPDQLDYSIQATPLGMGDAVFHGLDKVLTENVLIIWGDQVAIRRQTLEFCLQAHEMRQDAILTLPTFLKIHPYIHFARDEHQRLSAVLQKREGDQMPPLGESDCGLFLFKTQVLKACMHNYKDDPILRGRLTQEINFLPLFPRFEALPGSILGLRIIEEEETIGVNTRQEAEILADLLSKRT